MESGEVEPEPLVCEVCGRTPRPGENAEDDWRVFYDGVGEGVTICPKCFEREFGPG
jgi:hypothetical protein